MYVCVCVLVYMLFPAAHEDPSGRLTRFINSDIVGKACDLLPVRAASLVSSCDWLAPLHKRALGQGDDLKKDPEHVVIN